jgi:hypothetical protein
MQGNSLVTQNDLAPMSAYMDMLPQWLNYLVAAFPQSKLAANTFAVYEDAFGAEEPETMREAARAAVEDLRFFPTVNELRVYVRRTHERAPAEQHKLPPHIFYRRRSRSWPTCPDCGERVSPEWDTCPACVDMERMAVAL